MSDEAVTLHPMTGFLYEEFLTALCVWREARGSSADEQRGVIEVIRNRTQDGRWPKTCDGVVLQKRQFSSFNFDDVNAVQWPRRDSIEWAKWAQICAMLHDEPWASLTKGATHYHTIPDDRPFPKWADPTKLTARIGAFKFYRL